MNLWMQHSSHHLGQFNFGFCDERDGNRGKLLCKASTVKVRGLILYPGVWRWEQKSYACIRLKIGEIAEKSELHNCKNMINNFIIK